MPFYDLTRKLTLELIARWLSTGLFRDLDRFIQTPVSGIDLYMCMCQGNICVRGDDGEQGVIMLIYWIIEPL